MRLNLRQSAYRCLGWIGLIVGLSTSQGAAAADHGPDQLPTVGSIQRLDPRLDALVPKDAKIEVLAMGFGWAEGPVWVTDGKGGLPADSLLCRVRLTTRAASVADRP